MDFLKALSNDPEVTKPSSRKAEYSKHKVSIFIADTKKNWEKSDVVHKCHFGDSPVLCQIRIWTCLKSRFASSNFILFL